MGLDLPRTGEVAAAEDLDQTLGIDAAGRDVIFRWRDPLPALWQWLALGYFFFVGARRGLSPLAASTDDIEWNGPAADAC